MRMADLKPGWAVVGNDGKRVGRVQQVGQNYLLTLVDGQASEISVPASAIANVEHDVIRSLGPATRCGADGMGAGAAGRRRPRYLTEDGSPPSRLSCHRSARPRSAGSPAQRGRGRCRGR